MFFIHSQDSQKANILIVDDTPANLHLLSEALREQDYKVRAVTSGEMALRAVSTILPDLILLDISMPVMDGYEVCKQLKSNKETSDIPVIFLSAYDGSENKERALEIGGVDYICKPFQLSEVLLRVRNHLQLQFSRNEIQRLNRCLEQQVQERTAQLQSEIKKQQYLATHDTLTGLPNRSFFINALEESIADQHKSNSLYAVLFLDFNRFKLINDSLGHIVGDRMLVQITRRLESCLSSKDLLARLGGDEFTILIEDIEDEAEAVRIAKRITKSLKDPFKIDSKEIVMCASIGIVIGTTDYLSSDTIIRDADTAMYRAKRNPNSNYQIFVSDMHDEAQQILQLEISLRKAIKRNEFCLYYQPIFSCISNELVGFEALIRWNHPEKGFISPVDFIPVAEDTGLIIPIGMWVLKEACQQLKRWTEKYTECDRLTMSVNLSAKQFSQKDLITSIEKLLQKTGLDSHRLKLEITESALIDNSISAPGILNELKARNIQLSLDDFGTGYSSLSYLRRFPIDTLKIDRSFVQEIEDNEDYLAIVKVIADLAQNLGMDIVAEGIETEIQLNKLRDIGCENGQGYYFSKPLPPSFLEEIYFTANREESCQAIPI